MIDTQNGMIWAGMCLLTCYLGARLRFHLPTVVALAWTYFTLCAVSFAFNWAYAPVSMQKSIATTIQWNAARIALMLFLMPAFVIQMKDWRSHILSFFCWAFVLDAGVVLWTGYSFLFSSKTFATAVYVLLVPYIFALSIRVKPQLHLWVLLFSSFFITMVLKTHSGTGGLVLIAMATAYFLHKRRPWAAGLTLASSAGAMWLAWRLIHDWLKLPDARLPALKAYARWWVSHGDPWFGVGTGSLEYVASFMPIPINGQDLYFRGAHCEYFQILFDTGLLGLCLFIGAAIALMHAAWKHSTWLFCTGAGIFACMLTYYPLRYFPSQMLLLTFTAFVLKDRYAEKNSSN